MAGKSTRVLIALVLSFLWVSVGNAQTTTLTPMPKFQAFNNSGQPCAGCKLYSYAAGTSTPQATYTDSTGGTPNANPVVLDAYGRANVWLSALAYKLVLTTPGGTVLYSTDNILAGANSLLSTNNVWLGTNEFTLTTTFDSTVDALGPVNVSGPLNATNGGELDGTFTGTPSFANAVNFAAGFTSTTGTFSDQIISTVATGTAPFVVASTTKVVNLNADQLDGCDWAVPCPLGSVTPNTVHTTTVTVDTGIVYNGASLTGTGVVGNSNKIASAGTMGTTAGAIVCNDGSKNITDSGCSTGYTKLVAVHQTASICTPGSSSTYDACSFTFTWGATFADTNYVATCTMTDPNANTGTAGSNDSMQLYINSKTTTTMSLIIQNLRSTANTPNAVDCVGIHP